MMIVSVYASILALLFLWLSIRVITLRRSKKIAIGTRNDQELTRAIRVQANFSEYVPLAILLLAFLELNNLSPALLHLLCILLLTGRSIHAYGVSKIKEDFRFRVAGMLLTLSTIAIAALINIGIGLLMLIK